MRGKDAGCLVHHEKHRITPACAGKRQPSSHVEACVWDHPRVCGEKPPLEETGNPVQGSPPRMRGKDGVNDSAQAVTGITPACAGKRVERSRRYARYGDHPRVCGEKSTTSEDAGSLPGSPPRVRGKAHDGRQVLRGLRRHLKCDRDGHLRLVQVGNVVHERALMPDVHESQSRRTPQRHNDRMGQPVQAGMHGRSHGCRGRAAAPKCPAHHPWLLPPCRMVIRPRP